jgi:L-iditol 2-dehydrogenase
MKALVKYGQKPGEVEIRDVPEPAVRPGSVLVEVKAASICGWDIEMWQNKMANPVTVPVIQGHEFCGVIAEVGKGAGDWKKGERVTCETSAIVCGKCPECMSGNYQVCPSRKGFGYGVDGAFAKYVVVRREILHRVPESISFEEAALTEPFCVGHNALVDRVRVSAGDTVLVIGPGPIGLIALQFARLCGASQTILVGIDADSKRMDIAMKAGWAGSIINAQKENAVDAVMKLTKGNGADVVADCAGNSAALLTALDSVKRLGQIVKVGWGPAPFNHSLDTLLRKSAMLTGTFGHNWHNWEAVLKLFSMGKLDPRSLITDVLPLSKWHEAFERIEAREAIKIVLIPE